MLVGLLSGSRALSNAGPETWGRVAGAAELPPFVQREDETDPAARARERRERKEAVAAALLPTRPADVINRSERELAPSSRAFRRALARESGAAQFREQRAAFRQALASARSAQPGTDGGGSPGEVVAESGRGGTSEGLSLRRAQWEGRPTPPAAPGSQQPAPTARGSAVARGLTAAEGSGARAVAGASAQAAATGAPPGGVPATSVKLPPAPTINVPGAGLRVASPPATQATHPGSNGSAKASAPPAVVAEARAAEKPSVATARRGASAPAGSADREANLERILRLVRNRIGEQRTRTVLRLDPPELGRLRLELDLRRDVLSLRMETSTHVAQRLLTEDIDRLRHGLEAAGLVVERIEVRPPPQADAGQPDTPPHGGQQSAQQGQSDSSDAERPAEQGTEAEPGSSRDGSGGAGEAGSAAEPLVNVVA